MAAPPEPPAANTASDRPASAPPPALKPWRTEGLPPGGSPVSYAEARRLLREHRNRLDAIVEQLLARETLDEADVYAAAGIARPSFPAERAEPLVPPRP